MTRLSTAIGQKALAVVAALSVAMALQPSPAMAWGTEGHRIVAAIAENLLEAPAKARIDALLATEPGATLRSISTWADETRDRSTAAWHYVNMPRGSDCIYDRARDCPDGCCVVEALNTQVRRLNAPSPAEQLEALKYVVHLVADVQAWIR